MVTSVRNVPEQRHRVLQRYSGAVVRRVIDRSHSEIAEHAHDWPMVSVFVLGAYTNTTEMDEKCISGPSILFYRGGATHRNIAGPHGFEQVEIEFDPTWLGVEHVPDTPVQRWISGSAVSLWRALRTATVTHSESGLRATLRQVLRATDCSSEARSPQWVRDTVSALRENPSLRVYDVAQSAGLHPSWTGNSYRRHTGENLRDTTSRLRVEQAAYLLRETDKSCASIALDSGFCDQSHMNRVFRKVLGRPPMEVRSDRAQFR